MSNYSRNRWRVWKVARTDRAPFLTRLQPARFSVPITGGLNQARKVARVEAQANLHFHLLEGIHTAGWGVRITCDFAGHDRSLEERWLASDGARAVRIFPGPMPARTGTEKPRHAAAKASMVDTKSLRAAWGLAWVLDPSHAVDLVVQARRILRTGPATRAWFEEGLGAEAATIGGLLAMFWPDAENLSNDGGYTLDPMSLAFKKLLKALGRPEWARAEASLQHYRGSITRRSYRRNAKGDCVPTKRKGLWKNGRKVDIGGVARFWTMVDGRAASLADRARVSGYQREGFVYTPQNASSIACLILYRHTVAKRLQALRLAFHACGAFPPPTAPRGFYQTPTDFGHTPEQAAAAALGETKMEAFPLGGTWFCP